MTLTIETFADLQDLCRSGAAEGLGLEFKTKENPTVPELTRSEKRTIAQAVSAFANSDGGTLIYGVRTTKRDGLDVADELVAMAGIESVRAQAHAICKLNI